MPTALEEWPPVIVDSLGPRVRHATLTSDACAAGMLQRLSRGDRLHHRVLVQLFPVVRLAARDEAALVASILYESFADHRAMYDSAAFDATVLDAARITARMREGPVWVALEGGVAVGTVSAVVRDSATYVRGMGVVPRARGHGTGRSLLAAVEAFAAAERCERLLLSTTPFLAGAIRLYERSGFVRTGDGPGALFETPLLGMSKTLRSAEASRVELRAMQPANVPFVLAAEAAPHASPFITRWDHAQHVAALTDPDLALYIVTARADRATVGFILLAGLRRDDRVIELRRIVITTPGLGLGRAAIRCVKHLAFDAFGCRRLWLDVKPDNARARALYASEGFREDGTPGTDALIIMSMSRDDHALTG